MRELLTWYLGSMGAIVTFVYFTVLFIKGIIKFANEEKLKETRVYRIMNLTNESILCMGFLGGIPMAILMTAIC